MKKKIKYLAVIPARKDSKRIINKNLIKINKKELVKFTIEAARKTKKIQEIILTSDDAKILNIAKKSKIIAFKRPRGISRDSSTTEQATRHVYVNYCKKKSLKVENIILLQPTSPLRNSKHINECINLFEKKNIILFFQAIVKKNLFGRIKKKSFIH